MLHKTLLFYFLSINCFFSYSQNILLDDVIEKSKKVERIVSIHNITVLKKWLLEASTNKINEKDFITNKNLFYDSLGSIRFGFLQNVLSENDSTIFIFNNKDSLLILMSFYIDAFEESKARNLSYVFIFDKNILFPKYIIAFAHGYTDGIHFIQEEGGRLRIYGCFSQKETTEFSVLDCSFDRFLKFASWLMNNEVEVNKKSGTNLLNNKFIDYFYKK